MQNQGHRVLLIAVMGLHACVINFCVINFVKGWSELIKFGPLQDVTLAKFIDSVDTTTP